MRSYSLFLVVLLLVYIGFMVRRLVIFVVYVEVLMLVLLWVVVSLRGVYSFGCSLLSLGLLACEASFALCLVVSLSGGVGMHNGSSASIFRL